MVIGITGGIGSGKSIVVSIIKQLGGTTLSIDEINAKLMTDKKYIATIKEHFPSVVENDVINRRALGKIVFYEKNKLKILNSLAHPIIIELTKHEIAKSLLANKHVFVEAPLLVECNMTKMFDRIWVVRADMKLRINRICMRDLVDSEYAKKVMQNQISDEEREIYATDIIENQGSYEDLFTQVKNLYNALC